MDVVTLATGLEVSSQIPLDARLYVASEELLLDFSNTNTKFKYHRGMNLFVLNTNDEYRWLEVGTEDSTLYEKVGISQVYPNGTTAFGIDYSNKTYSFYKRVYPSGDSERLTNKTVADPLRTKLLLDESDYKIRGLKAAPSTGLKVTILAGSNELTISKETLEYSDIFIDNNVAEWSGDRFNNLDQVRQAINRGDISLSPGARLRALGTENLVFQGDLPERIASLDIPSSNAVTLAITNRIASPLRITGGGTVNIQNLKTSSRLIIDDVDIVAETPIDADINADVEILNSNIGSGTLIASSGSLKMNRVSFSDVTTFSNTGSPIIMNSGTVSLTESNIGSGGVIDASAATSGSITLSGNTVNDGVTNELIEGNPSIQVTSFGNNMNNAKLASKATNTVSYNDANKGGVITKLPVYESRERAILELGKDHFFLNDSDKKNVFVDYTYEE